MNYGRRSFDPLELFKVRNHIKLHQIIITKSYHAHLHKQVDTY